MSPALAEVEKNIKIATEKKSNLFIFNPRKLKRIFIQPGGDAMKKILTVFIILLIGCCSCISCSDDNDDNSNVPIFSNYEDIINPPDKFILYMPLKNYGENRATIIFDTSNVWKIYRITNLSTNFWIELHPADSVKHFFITQDTLRIGLKDSVSYFFYSSPPTYEGKNKLMVMFEKTAIDYDNFLPKF